LVVSEQKPAGNGSRSGFPVNLVAGIAIAAAVGGTAIWRYRTGPR
jgi:hypothetical protein